jgi:hypothetical protein
LSWKLALNLENNPSDLKKTMESYELERKSIAQQTSDLSMVNFHKVLNVSKLIGMDMKNMQMLLGVLRASEAPQFLQKSVFRAGISLGQRLPSILFNSDSTLTRTRSLISSGGALPLSFPGQDLGQKYLDASSHFSSSDPFTYTNSISPGGRYPHRWISHSTSTLDLISQSSAPFTSPRYLELDSYRIRPDGHIVV